MSEQVSNRQHAMASLNAYASRDRVIRNAVLLLLSYFFFSFSFNKIVSFEVFSFSYGEKTSSILKDTQHFLSTGVFHCADDVKNCNTYKTLITQQLPGIMKTRLLPDAQDVFDVFDDKFSKDWHLPFPFVLHENADAIFIINAISNAIALSQEPSSASSRKKERCLLWIMLQVMTLHFLPRTLMWFF